MPTNDTTEVTIKLTDEEKDRIESETGERIDELEVPTTESPYSDTSEQQEVRI